MFDPVDPKQSLPDLEAGILKYWREEDIFKRSMERRCTGEVFSFYDGPPFATGLPHYGHILAGTIKDVIPRYQTMRGRYVKRRFGWDCHGLPIENLIEKENNLKTKKDIEDLGIAKFNDLCRAAVQRYTKEWRATIERLGRFVDMDWDYRTMDPEFMESVWWVFKQLHKQKLIYESYKSMHICPRCQTPLSNFEVTQGYKDIQDYSITAMFELEDERDTFALAWTTTGWTLPGNALLAVHPDTEYATVASEGGKFIVAKDLVPVVFKGKTHSIVSETTGKKLAGRKYKPLFPYFIDQLKETGFRIVTADFVTTTDGTGIVHIATGYGEDDFELSKREKTPVIKHVGMDGLFTKEVKDFAGKAAKPKDDHQSGDKMVAKWLKDNGKLFKAETFSHSYPHCWRCDSPLLNYATTSWFVAVEEIKPKMLESNSKTNWVPQHIRDGRFGKWLEGAKDWAISRNRFWGTPLPIWKNTATGEVEVLASRDDLMVKSQQRFTKLTICRHAESEGNMKKVYQCKEPGTDLTEGGQKQASELADLIKEKSKTLKVSAIYCSPLLRTQTTAAAISKAVGVPIVIDDRLRETAFGEYEGTHQNFDDLTFVRERRAHKMETGQVESIYHFHGMETWGAIQKRVWDFMEEILPKHRGESVVVVTHADLAMNFAHAFTGEDPHKIVHQPYPKLGGSRTFYWDHERKAQMDLHKETVDNIAWAADAKKGDSVELTLMRHGQTDMNKQKLLQGETDMILNKIGKEQAAEAAEQLKGQKFDVIVSSDYKRARETADIVAKTLKLDVVTNELFRERRMGEWNGLPVEEVLVKIGTKKQGAPTVTLATPPGGESFEQFLARVRKAHDWLTKEYGGKKILLVTHGGFFRLTRMIVEQLPYEAAASLEPKNSGTYELTLKPQLRRIDDVLDCWFESGSMPYAQEHFPFGHSSDVPPGFPAHFIAEGLDQTRGWFYTLTVLSSALFNCPAFRNCVVNGIVLAEDGKKMSKRLKNYPEPTEVINKHGADAVRFALMMSSAVRGEDLRFSEKLVSDTTRSVLLPLWNAYRLFVTYANAVDFKPSIDFSLRNSKSEHLLDRWIVLKTQELVNAMTEQLERYDLSATCLELAASIDDLTNWYVRLSRRRLAGKEQGSASAGEAQASPSATADGQADALDTLFRVLIANIQLLAPFCPFITEAIYLNLVPEDHGSVHFADWPSTADVAPGDRRALELMENTRRVVTLGLSLRSELNLRVRQPLQSVTVALPRTDEAGIVKELIAEELNVKEVILTDDPGALGTPIAQIDARKVGPRLGQKVQELIKAGKAGQFEEKDGKIIVLGEELSPEEAKIIYQGKEGHIVAADHGVVVTIDQTVTDALKLEGEARELIHAIQNLRKDAGLEFTDTITLEVKGAEELMQAHERLILDETRSSLGAAKGEAKEVEIGVKKVSVKFEKIR